MLTKIKSLLSLIILFAITSNLDAQLRVPGGVGAIQDSGNGVVYLHGLPLTPAPTLSLIAFEDHGNTNAILSLANFGGTTTGILPTPANSTLGTIFFRGMDINNTPRVGASIRVTSLGDFDGANKPSMMEFTIGNNSLLTLNGPSQVVEVDGQVQIGDVNVVGNYKLYVEDGILAEKVKVAAATGINWSDYVFEEDYHLNTIEEVEIFIQENQHLPNVPSAAQVNEEGVDMVEMDATLLRQIEELWLHMIEMKKELQTVKDENETLRAEVKALNVSK